MGTNSREIPKSDRNKIGIVLASLPRLTKIVPTQNCMSIMADRKPIQRKAPAIIGSPYKPIEVLKINRVA